MSATIARPRPRRHRINWTDRLRRLTQLVFAGFIIVSSLRHGLGKEASAATPSLDALCPFGAVETLWMWITTGRFVPKTHPSNMVLGLGLLIGVLLAGSAFCGWVCPFGSMQDLLDWVRRRLHLPVVELPKQADAILRYGRFVTLAMIVYATANTSKLWFAEYDPYRTLFSLGWLFEFNLAEQWPGFVVLGTIIVGALLIPRFWCRYACPLGGLMSIFGNLSILRIRRNETSCRGCALCETPCPVGIAVAEASPAVSPNCIGCLACVQACPRHGTLTVQVGPTWYDGLKKVARRLRGQPTAA
jgi:polyferredoxin